jgi:DNA-binding CsgD family transcriptional regulator
MMPPVSLAITIDGARSAMPDPSLLEREAQLAALNELLSGARAGEGGCAAIVAAAGLGKSRLLAEAAAAARDQGMEVIAARGDELEREFSFGIVLSLLGPVAARADEDERARLLRGAAGLAAPLVVGARPEEALASEHQAFSLLHGLHWLVANLAERRPLLLAVDDAHWADEMSLRFLHYLLQRVDELPVALVVAARPESEVGPGLVRRLARHRLTSTLDLAPLSEAGVARLVREEFGAHAEDEFCAACANASGGNPFYLGELLAAVRADELPPTAASASVVERVDATAVDRVVLRRLAGLEPAAADLAKAVAVLGDGSPPSHVARLAGLEADAAVRCAETLAGAAVLREDAALRFTHPLVRAAIYGDISAARCATMHGRAAALLAESGADAERVAQQLLLAGPASDGRREADVLAEAGELAVERGAPAAAARYLRGALDRLPREDPQLISRLAAAEIAAHEGTGRDRALSAVAAQDEPGRRGEVALRLGLALVNSGRQEEGADVLDRGIAAVEDDRDHEELLMTLRASRAVLRGFEAAIVASGGLEVVLERIESGGATPAERLMLAHGALAPAMQGRDIERVRELARAAVAGGPEDVGEPSTAMSILISATALLLTDDLREAETLLDGMVRHARERGLAIAYAGAVNPRAHVRHRQGRLTEAIADAQSALDAARYGWEPSLPAAHAAMALCRIERGELDEAEAALEMPGGDGRWEDMFTFNDLLEARARFALERGDAEHALQLATECGRRMESLGSSHPSVVPWRSTAVRAAAALGDRHRAAELAERDVEEARAFGAAGPLGLTLRTQGVLAGGDRGIDLLREANEVLAGSPATLERAHAACELGAMLLGAEHRIAARDPLREGLDLAVAAGAVPLADRARSLLLAAGARPRRARSRGRDALTPREHQIAELAAGGASNREIAEALFVTRKTVEAHLAATYRKLDVSSRRDLAARLEATDPLEVLP